MRPGVVFFGNGSGRSQARTIFCEGVTSFGSYRWRQYSDEQARADRADLHSRHWPR
ncbi:hypothetical protein MCP1_50073 [Candidatus Terasakiella magnetica]|nr:hypothetical protein MCP1_50073 [Candidatus Terasakiella magnetica]